MKNNLSLDIFLILEVHIMNIINRKKSSANGWFLGAPGLKSRHSNQTKHNTFVQYDKVKKAEPIKAWYCNCRGGARVVETFTHLAINMAFRDC